MLKFLRCGFYRMKDCLPIKQLCLTSKPTFVRICYDSLIHYFNLVILTVVNGLYKLLEK